MPGRVISGMCRQPSIGDVLIDLVAHRIGVVADQQIGDERQFRRGEHLAGRVHRRVEQDRLGLRPEGGGQLGARQLPARRLQPHQPGHRAQQAHHRQVGVVQRLDQHHLVARVEQRHQAGGDRLGGAGGHHHLGCRGRPAARRSGHWRRPPPGAVPAGRSSAGTGCARPAAPRRRRAPRPPGPSVSGKPLAEIDRAMPGGERRHDGEDGRSGRRQQGVGRFTAGGPPRPGAGGALRPERTGALNDGTRSMEAAAARGSTAATAGAPGASPMARNRAAPPRRRAARLPKTRQLPSATAHCRVARFVQTWAIALLPVGWAVVGAPPSGAAAAASTALPGFQEGARHPGEHG